MEKATREFGEEKIFQIWSGNMDSTNVTLFEPKYSAAYHFNILSQTCKSLVINSHHWHIGLSKRHCSFYAESVSSEFGQWPKGWGHQNTQSMCMWQFKCRKAHVFVYISEHNEPLTKCTVGKICNECLYIPTSILELNQPHYHTN